MKSIIIRSFFSTALFIFTFHSFAQCTCADGFPNNEADLANGGDFCGTGNINVGGSITITGDICWSSGTLRIDGNGGETEFTLNNGVTLEIAGGEIEVDDGGADILGDIVIGNGGIFRQSANNNVRINGGTITVQNGGLLDVQDDFLVYNGAVFTIDDGGIANIGDDLRNSPNGNSGPGSLGTIIVNGALNVPDADAEIVIYDTEPNDSNLGGTGILTYGGPFTDGEEGIFAGCTSPCNGAVLPVELINFEGSLIENRTAVSLSWSTGTEINNEGFYIEKSINGENWEILGFVEGNGNTSDKQQYSFNDIDISQSSYYRLKQVDYDGQFEYSWLIFVSIVEAGYDPIVLSPNPVSDNMSLDGLINEIYDIQITDLSGKIFLVINKSSLLSAEKKINDLLYLFPKGLYVIKFANPGYVEVIKLIKN